MPAASSPSHFQANVARWRSSEPSNVCASSPATGGSLRICPSPSVIFRSLAAAFMRRRPFTRLRRVPDTDDGFARLREDVRFLGALLGQVVAESGGSDLYDDVEQLRQAARDARRGSDSEAPLRIVEGLSLDRAEDVARAFATLFHLVNLAEERHRVRVLRSRDRDDLTPAEDSLAGAFARLAADEINT